jgi:hypothetical protein
MLRIGIVGLDTSHCPAFTRLLNDESQEYHVPGARVVAVYPGGSMQFSLSRDRVAGFTEELRSGFGVRIVERIEDLLGDVDAILLESVDGRQHLEQFRLLAAGKPVYIDKPLACSTADAREIIRLADRTGTPLMSCSSLRYAAGIADLLPPDVTVLSAEGFGPAPILDDYPGLFWYGVHAAEILFTLLGTGCERVRCVSTQPTDIAVGLWADGRVGVLRGTRFEHGDFGCVAHTTAGTVCGLAGATPPYYALLLQRVVEFCRTGNEPIAREEMFGVVAFLEAAEVSKRRDGAEVGTETL